MNRLFAFKPTHNLKNMLLIKKMYDVAIVAANCPGCACVLFCISVGVLVGRVNIWGAWEGAPPNG